MADTPPLPICGEPLNYPPPICTRPRGHDGLHETSIIPPELAPVAARMMREADSLESERIHHVLSRRDQDRRVRVLSIALAAALALNLALAIGILIGARFI